MAHELGIYGARRGEAVPEEASWVVPTSPAYGDINLLENPGFEFGLQGWQLYTPTDTTPMQVDIRPGYIGNSVVLVSNELGYRGSVSQYFRDLPPNTTLRFRAMIKTVDIENLRTRILAWAFTVGGVWQAGGELAFIEGYHDWALYEVSFTTPNEESSLSIHPATVYNRGEVWIDEASLTVEEWSPPPRSILNWAALHSPFYPVFNPFVTAADLNYVEEGLKTVPTENFWGIIFIAEEHYRSHIEFEDTLNTTWFGEQLLGYPLYLAENPTATRDQWLDEMFLRMIRGFHNYFSPLTKVGITAGAGAIVTNWKNQSWSGGIPKYYGEPAMTFIRKHYDFVILYVNADNLGTFTTWTRQYLQLIDQLFVKQQKLWILSRIWSHNVDTWQPESMALELKNAFDRNIPVLMWSWNDPPPEVVWPLMLRARELYDAKAPYTESIVSDENLLTGQVGDTYGWVANPEHDEGLYPTPISPFGKLTLPLAIIGGVLLLKDKGSKRRNRIGSNESFLFMIFMFFPPNKLFYGLIYALATNFQ